MSTPVSEDQSRSKKPSSSAFKQQRLPAWQPILTAGTVLPTFFIIGIAFIPIGIGLLVSSNNVQEIVIDYTQCTNLNNHSCAESLKTNIRTPCVCSLKFELAEDFRSDVFMYYGLTNFYQNHRRYVKSRDDSQLLGRLDKVVNPDCEPFAYINSNSESKTSPIAPCGAIANSLFNDTLSISFNGVANDQRVLVPLLAVGIAWPTDKEVKFKNPPGGPTEDAFRGFYKPFYWQKNVTQLDPNNDSNNGFQNEDLIVWMRTAALPTFRKLYRRIDHSMTQFKSGLPKGNYTLEITYNYPVTSFDGTKRMILSTTSWLGGKNPFLGIAYIVVGCVCLVLGFVFLVIHIKFSKSTHDMVNVTQRTAF